LLFANKQSHHDFNPFKYIFRRNLESTRHFVKKT